jgi:YD repeat-containing protein
VNTYFATSVTYANGKTLRYQGDDGLQAGAWSVLQNNGLLVKRDSNGNYVIVNLAYEYCDPNPAVTCALTQAWPTAHEVFGTNSLTITDATGGSYVITAGTYPDIAITSYHDKNWSPGTTITYVRCKVSQPDCYYYDSSTGTQSNLYFRVESATKNGVTYRFNYTWNIGQFNYEYGVTAPYSKYMVGYARSGLGYPSSFSDERGRIVYFDGTVDARAASVNYPENNRYTYDGRGNLTDIKTYDKLGALYATIHADYDTSCTLPAKCNKPNDYIDRNGNETDYAYDNTTGLIMNETLPAVKSPGGTMVHPIERYHYVQRSAWYLNSNGAYAKDAKAIWLLDTEKTCRTGGTDLVHDTCSISGDEVATAYDYGPDSGPNNLWLRGIAVTAGGVTHRTCYAYDRFGNKISQTTPNANLVACP